MELTQLQMIFKIDGIVVAQTFREISCCPFVVFDTRFIGLLKLLESLLELGNVQTLVVKGKAGQDDGNIRVAPFSSWRGHAFSL